MNRKVVKTRALLLVAIFLTLSVVGTIPMILSDGTDGGGGSYYWDSAVAYPNSAFSASAYRTGTILARKTSPGVYGRVDAHLERDYTAPDDGYIRIKIYYQWSWYTDYYNHVYFGSSGLKDPLGQEVSDMLTLIDPFGIYGPEVSDYQSYTYTYMHVGYITTYIPVSDGVTYNLQFDLTILSIQADEFHLIGHPTSSALFYAKNVITFYYSIP